jgi:Domain of unknown function (DUF4189)
MCVLKTLHLPRLVSALLLLLTAEWLSSPAQAAFPCTWAPGEVQVGENNGVPVCEQRGGPAQGPAPTEMVWVDNHYALATHKEASDMWTAIGYPDGEAATQAAMAACNADMGGGCYFFLKSFNSSYTIGLGRHGSVYANWDATVAKARKRLTAQCRENNDICFEISTGTAKPGRKVAGTSFRFTPEIWRPQGNFRRVYAAAVQVDPSSSTYPVDVWIASGYSNPTDARHAALDACTNDSNANCQYQWGIANTFLYVAVINGKKAIVGSSPTAELAKSVMAGQCGKKLKCKLTGVFDSRQSGITHHSMQNGMIHIQTHQAPKE